MVGSEVPLRSLAAMIAAFTMSMTGGCVAGTLGFAVLGFFAGATTGALITNGQQDNAAHGDVNNKESLARRHYVDFSTTKRTTLTTYQ